MQDILQKIVGIGGGGGGGGVRIQDKYRSNSDRITHLIVDEGSKAKRTLKHLYAILDGAWILSFGCKRQRERDLRRFC